MYYFPRTPRRKASWKNESKNSYNHVEHSVSRNRDGVEENRFTISFELQDSRKSTPNVSEIYLEELLDVIVAELRSKKGYSSAVIGLGTIDYYTDEVYPYEVPSLIHRKGKRKYTLDEHTHYSIPKDWEIFCSVTFVGEMSIRMRNSILDFLLPLVHFEYDNKLRKQVKELTEKWNVEKKLSKQSQTSLVHLFSD